MLKQLPISQSHQDLLYQFSQHLRAVGYTPATIRALPSGVREFLWRLEQADGKLEEVQSSHLKAHYAYLLERPSYAGTGALSLHTIDGYLFALKVFFNWLQVSGTLADNPMSTLHFPQKRSGERAVVTLREVQTLYAACANELERAVLSLCYACGLRKSEVEHLNLRDVDLRGLWLYVRQGKGKKRRVIPLTESIAGELKAYLYHLRPLQISRWTTPEDTKALLLNKRGGRLRGGPCWKLFKALVKRAGMSSSIGLHSLRHSIATHLLAGGMSIEAVRDFLGHDYLESTQIYTRVSQQQLRL